MKFAAVLRDNAEELPDLADLFALYKQLKKSLKRIPNRGGDTDHSEASQDTQPTSAGAQQAQQGPQQQQQQQQEEAAQHPPQAASAEKPSSQEQAAAELAAATAAGGGGVKGGPAPRSPGSGGSPLPKGTPDTAGTTGATPAGAGSSSGLSAEQQLFLDEQEQEFLRTITEDVQKLNDSYIEKEELNVIKLGALEERAACASTPSELQDAYKTFVDFHGELLLLLHWSILAYTGVVKILKKHHKRTGLLLRAPHLENLLSQPFCSVEVTCDMVRRAEAQVNTLAARLQVPPACPVAAAAGAAAAAAAAMAPGETVDSPFHRTLSDANLHSATRAAQGGDRAGSGPAGAAAAAGSAPQAGAGSPVASPPAGTKRGAEEAGVGGGVGEGSQMMRRTRAALNVWQHLQVNAATPSTVLPSGHHPTQAAASGMTNQSAA